MGVRFRLSSKIAPGVKLNFGKTGMSVSAGVPGFHKTIHTSGKVTTSAGIPGTGIYYVDTKNINKSTTSRTPSASYGQSTSGNSYDSYSTPVAMPTPISPSMPVALISPSTSYNEPIAPPLQFDAVALKSVHKTSDDSIDWTEVLVSPVPPDDSYNREMWQYYHGMAGRILSGDVDAYLQLIYEVNPLDDLLPYGGDFEFGTDQPWKMEVEFNVNASGMSDMRSRMSRTEYNLLLQDYICSVCIRIARDMFALLPVTNTIVHAVLGGKTVVSVDFDRATLSRVKFGYIDPSDTLERFRHNMRFSDAGGFLPIENLI